MLRLIIAVLLLAHGVGHVMGFLGAWTSIPSGLSGGHWLLSNTVTLDSALGRAFGLLWLVAMIGTVGAALVLLFQQGWWQPLAVAAAILSLVAIGPWLNVMPVGSAIGAVLVDLVVLIALLGPWHDTLTRALR
jgi:hypothetical protein